MPGDAPMRWGAGACDDRCVRMRRWRARRSNRRADAPASAAHAVAPGSVAHAGAPKVDAPVRRLQRAASGRMVAGVCRGLSEHLGIDLLWVRVGFVVLTIAGGAGIAMYAAFWIFAPIRVDDSTEPESGGSELGYVAVLAIVAVGALLGLRALGVGLSPSVAWPVVVAGLGVVVLWRQADDAQRARWRAVTGATRGAGLLRAVVGAVLLLAGLASFLAMRGETSGVTEVLVASLGVVLGLALVSGPWWMRMARDLAAERSARIREQERAELAAHLHDSVLHTLTLIQRSIDDPREVARLARAQERDLRAWLYRPVADPDTTLSAAVQRVAAEVEDAHGVTVDVVLVGDARLDERLRALLLAAREALVNAAKYAGDFPISLYVEVEPGLVMAFVRDRGSGFDLDAVPEDRLGVRQSIVGRMDRNGGRAMVRRAPDGGTEVQLEMPVNESDTTGVSVSGSEETA
jgi:signal transduction histidine kinase